MVEYNQIVGVLRDFRENEPSAYQDVIQALSRHMKLIELWTEIKKNINQDADNQYPRVALAQLRKLHYYQTVCLAQPDNEARIFRLLSNAPIFRGFLYSLRASAPNMINGIKEKSCDIANKLIRLQSQLETRANHASILVTFEDKAIRWSKHVYLHSPAASTSVLFGWMLSRPQELLPTKLGKPFSLIMTLLTILLVVGNTLNNPMPMLWLTCLCFTSSSFHYAISNKRPDYEQALMRERHNWMPSVSQLQVLQTLLLSVTFSTLTQEYSLMVNTLLSIGAGAGVYYVGEGVARLLSLYAPLRPDDRFMLIKAVSTLAAYAGYNMTKNIMSELTLRDLVDNVYQPRLLNPADSLSAVSTSSDGLTAWQWFFALKLRPMRVIESHEAGAISRFRCSPQVEGESLFQFSIWRDGMLTITRKGEHQSTPAACWLESRSPARLTVLNCQLSPQSDEPLSCQIESSVTPLGML